MGKAILYSVYIIYLILTTRVSNISASTNHNEEHLIEIHCSRERSRAAWNIIENYLMPFVEKEKFTLSTQCKLHPSNDIFREQEEHKIHVDVNEWKCGYCKKHFRDEKFLDQHFDNRHLDLLSINSSHGRCLADLCGALHCDYAIDSAQSRKTKCNPSAAVRNRHLCEDLADRCFPITEGAAATRLHEFFLRQFCDAHTCSRGWKPFSKGGRKHTSVLYMAASVLILMLLPIFYLIVYMIQRETRTRRTQLKRASKPGRKHI
ncbi:hypothetical protein PHJA_001636600 [Phtheirospermum japonicum]|uniref:C2H2-type domain-containing protein n=1 Tax=Phtheirospermum japonicum TaxID=374723 RepID=A0A830C9P2_9LAMI|nr:hypothetical protein PHJA_001636600 [Phtheirospermum japonicum]